MTVFVYKKYIPNNKKLPIAWSRRKLFYPNQFKQRQQSNNATSFVNCNVSTGKQEGLYSIEAKLK